ncbi:MAG: hypothetical protein ACJ8GN_19070 [Longimicrobiaceae bacterium]
MKPRHRKPTFAESLAPKEERKPRATPESDRERSPVWLVGRIDFTNVAVEQTV